MQYDNALRQKAEKEFEADFASSNTTVACGSQSLIERQFQLEYTHAKFAEVQNEFRGKINCFVKRVFEDGCLLKYTVKEEWLWEGKKYHRMHDVVLDTLTTNIQCSCMLFEFRGIMCRHSLLTLGQEDMECVPKKYVLHRWSKNVRRRHSVIIAGYNRSNDDPRMQRYKILCKRFYDLAEVACDSDASSTMLCNELNSIAEGLGVPTKSNPFLLTQQGHIEDNGGQHPGVTNCSNIRSPVHVKRKGRPRTNRLQSTVEKLSKKRKMSAAKNKSQRTAQVCIHVGV